MSTTTPGSQARSATTTSIRAEDRFWASVEKTDACWLWQRSVNTSGYGQFWINGERKVIHRIAYELTVGAIPEGLTLDHLCRVRHCVNPAHLEPVTMRENTLRGNAPSAMGARKTHCPQGHPYDLFNTKAYGGRRYCRTCQNTLSRVYRARLKAAQR